MIFFDDGCVQYQYHKNIRLVAYKFDNKLLLSEFHPDYRGFIKSYLDKYPERQMVRLINDHIIRVEYKNEWILAKVLEVDASLVKLYFIEKNCVEWLYRGSPRLWNIYEKQSKSDRGIRSRQSGLAYLKKPFVEYSSIEEPSRPAKTVARKSSTKSSTTQYEETKKLIPNNNVSSVLNLFSLPSNCLVPKKFVYHKCSFRCVEWTEYNYMKTKRINMLAVPLHFGFTRCVLNFNISQKCIIYRTPCGLGMRNLKEMHDYLIKTKSKMTIDQFDFNSWVRPLAEFKIVKHKIYSIDMSEGKEFKSISLVNTLSFETPPKMEYMTVRKAMPGVNINVENEFLCGCDCTDNCQDKSKCACWQLTIEGQKILPNLDQDPNIGYSYRRLPERVLTGIYECNKTCKCSKSCLNRVVQNPLSQKLQLFLTEKKGWGVRCLNDIPQGSFICIYVGYLLTETDANEGGKNYGDEYLAELDYIEVIEKIKEDYETDVVLSDDDYENNASNTNSESSSEDFQTTVRG
jgi:histone-lysine N-methyltransferase SETDB1